jgi:hypothetical protein
LLFSLPYVLGPLLVFFAVKSMALPAVEAIDRVAVPAEYQPFFQRTQAALAPEGLGLACYLRCSGIVEGTDNYAALLLDPRTGVVGGAFSLKPQHGQTLSYVEFTTAFADDRSLCTTNSPLLGSFSPVKEKRSFSFPKVADAATLHRLHRAAVELHGAGARPSVPTPTTLPSLVASSIHRDFARQAERGYYDFDPGNRRYRPTLKGATLMTWRQLFPWKWINRAHANREAAMIRQHAGV